MAVTRGRCLEGAAKRFVLMPVPLFLPSQPGLKGGSQFLQFQVKIVLSLRIERKRDEDCK